VKPGARTIADESHTDYGKCKSEIHRHRAALGRKGIPGRHHQFQSGSLHFFRYENEPKLEDCIDQKCLLFRFDDIEGGILLAKALQNLSLGDVMSSLYYFKKGYYLLLDQSCIKNDGLMSLCEEYGVLSTVSPFYIIEYGKLIVKDEAIETLQKYF